MTEFSVFMLLQDLQPEINGLEDVFFEGSKTYISCKCEDNKNTIIIGDFNSNVDKINWDGGNKTKKLCRYRSSYALSKLQSKNTPLGNSFMKME